MQYHDFIQLLFLLALGACSVCSAQRRPEYQAKAGLLYNFPKFVVQDNPVNQAVAMEMLASLGCACRLAANGFDALEAIAQDLYNVTPMDCKMPEMNGFDAPTAQVAAAESDCLRVAQLLGAELRKGGA